MLAPETTGSTCPEVRSLDNPAISVVVPVYNRARTIRVAIDSVLAQDFSDFEVVVVDDGSSDATADVVDAIPDSRVRCLRLPANRGVSAARNEGIRNARAPLTSFLDSDDCFFPHKLRFVVRFFAEHPEIDVLIDSFEIEFPPVLGKTIALRRNPELFDSAAVESAVFTCKVWKATPSLSARRHTLIAAGLFDETLRRREDMDLVLRLARSTRCASTPAVLWRKHQTDGSLSRIDDTYIPCLLAICRRHPNYLVRPEWRARLARDATRHLLRQIGRGNLAQVRRDAESLCNAIGKSASLRLFCEGIGEIVRRDLGFHRPLG